MKNRFLIGTLTVGGLILGGMTLAQSSANNADLNQTRLELQQQAQRLTLLAQVPDEARPEAEALLERAEMLHAAALQLEVNRLEALVAELESGTAADEASETVNDQFEIAFTEIENQQEQLFEDLQAFQETYPEALDKLGLWGGPFGRSFGANPFGQGGFPHMGAGPAFGHFGPAGRMNNLPFFRDGDSHRGFGFPGMRMR